MNPRVSNTQQASSRASRSSSRSGRGHSQSVDSHDGWHYQPTRTAAGAAEFEPAQQLPVPSSSSPSMIGPTSSFFATEHSAPGPLDNHTQYEQWLDVYATQQQQQQQPQQSAGMPQASMHSSYPASTNVQAPRPHQTATFEYSHSQYPPTGTVGQHVASGVNPGNPTLIQPDLFETVGTSYPGDANVFPHFYEPVTGNSSPDHSYHASTPDTNIRRYSNVSDPGYRQHNTQSRPSFSNTHPHQVQQSPHQPISPRSTHPLQKASSHTKPRNSISRQKAPPSQQQRPHKSSFPVQRPPTEASRARSSQTKPSTSPLGPQGASWKNDSSYTQSSSANRAFYQVTTTNPPVGPTESPVAQYKASAASSESPTNSTSRKTGSKRKRRKKDAVLETIIRSETDSDDDIVDMSGGISVGMGGLGVPDKGEKNGRLPGACSYCKKLKMKCDFPPNQDTCKRCNASGHACIVEGRRPRAAPNKREYLLAQIRQKDAIIESLLKQLHNPYIATPLSIASYRMATCPSDQNNQSVIAWLDRLQSSVRDAGQSAGARSFLEPQKGRDDDSDMEEGGPQTQLYSVASSANQAFFDSDGETVQPALPDATVPIGLLADLSLSNKKSGKKKDNAKDPAGLFEADLNDDNIGVANETYFMPGPATDLGIRASLIEQHSPPEILIHGLVKPEDVDKLFGIFYQRINPFISLLDPVLHTPATTFARCPFLFTVVCAICSRFYTEKSEIYPIAMHFAKHSAANALTDGWKSVELCQAYILMSIFAVPARRWEEDRSWLYTGLAIRIATDLNLHQISNTKPQSEKQEREILNKKRVWLICFNLDRSTSTQFGKPSTIKEDFLVRNSTDWYKKSKYNHPYDIHLCAYTALLRIVKKFHDEIFSDTNEPSGLNKKIDFKRVTLAHDAQLSTYHQDWSKRFQEESDPHAPGCVFRCSLLPFLVAYSRLVMFSFGFQHGFRRGFHDNDPLFFNTCLNAAMTVVRIMINSLAPSGYMRFAPDGHFVFASFASAFLLKLLKPEFSSFLTKEQETDIFDLVGRLIQTLSSPKIAIDDRHTPKLYARFLAGLLSQHRRDGAGAGRLPSNPPPQNQLPTSAPQATPGPSSLAVPEHPSAVTGNVDLQTSGETLNQGMVATCGTASHPAPSDIDPFLLDFDMTDLAGITEADMLATMQAIKNPAWWSNAMMPGWSWPENSPSPDSNISPSPTACHGFNRTVPGLNPPWDAYQGATVIM